MYMVRVRVSSFMKLCGLNKQAVEMIQYFVFPSDVFACVVPCLNSMLSIVSSDRSGRTCGF